MGNIRITSTPYDDVFRTLLNDCSSLIIPMINEMFGEHYSGQEKITFAPNEHFLNRQDGNEDERITDTSFTIEGQTIKKYHLECQSNIDNSMLIRFLNMTRKLPWVREINGNILTVTLPHSAVLFLRHRASTPDTLKVRMVTPGGTVEYGIHVMKSQQYTLEKILEKGLLLLIPFYIFSHESRFEEYEKDKAKLNTLQVEYEQIKNKLEELLNQGVISEYTRCTIIDMSNKVLEHIAVKFNSVREGVKQVMGGKVLEYEAKAIKREGIEEGIKGTVSILKNLGVPTQTILLKIQEQYGLSPEVSKKYL